LFFYVERNRILCWLIACMKETLVQISWTQNYSKFYPFVNFHSCLSSFSIDKNKYLNLL
jgi:hypothetical protein